MRTPSPSDCCVERSSQLRGLPDTAPVPAQSDQPRCGDPANTNDQRITLEAGYTTAPGDIRLDKLDRLPRVMGSVDVAASSREEIHARRLVPDRSQTRPHLVRPSSAIHIRAMIASLGRLSTVRQQSVMAQDAIEARRAPLLTASATRFTAVPPDIVGFFF